MQLVGGKEMAVKMKSGRFLNFSFFEVALILHRLFLSIYSELNPLTYLKTMGRCLNEN